MRAPPGAGPWPPTRTRQGYRFTLDGRAVAQLEFTAEGSPEDTAWFVFSIDAAAFDAAPEEPLRWLGDPWTLDVPGVDVDALAELARRDGRDALQAEARRVAQRTRSQALAASCSQGSPATSPKVRAVGYSCPMGVYAWTESRDQSADVETRRAPSGRGPAGGLAGLAGAIGNRAFASLYGRGLADPSAALVPAIGNRAFASLQRPALQRCGCRGACGCPGPSTTTVGPRAPALGVESKLDAIWWTALARRGEPGVDGSRRVAPVARRSRRTLQRSIFPPLARPFPPWSTKDPAQAPGDCVPFIDTNDAMIAWLIVKAGFHKAINDMCRDCPAQALEVYDAYMNAGGTPPFRYNEARDGLTCQIRSLKGDPDHEPAEQPVINAVRGNLSSLIPRLAGVPSVTLSLVDAGVPRTLIHPNPAVGCTRRNANDEPACLFLGSNRTFGSFLFGKGHESGSIVDSEYGNDTRDVDGTVELIKVGAPTDPTIQVRLVFRFEWSLVDAVDFCPGNTMSFNPRAHALLGTASELEATGMARDIFVSAQYTRIRDQLPPAGPFPNPDLRPPPAPRVVRLPAEVLFDFDQDELRPGAAATLIRFLGTRPTRQDPGRRVQVRGHTDSKGSAVYNQGLSERRARTVADLLERQYPNLVGRVDPLGFGATQPVAPNSNPDGSDNPSGRAANRRVDIEFDIDEP